MESPRDAAPSIDCVAAGAGTRRDASLLPGVFVAHIDLSSFCATFGCPYQNLRDFFEKYSCSPVDAGAYTPEMDRIVGCGMDSVGGLGLFGGTEYVFDSATGELVGATIGSDSSFGPCNTGIYIAGPTRGSCATEILYDCRSVK